VLKLIIIGVIVLLVLWAVGMYNGLIKLRNLVQEAWRQIDVELKRRHDLIPNLVETVKGYAAHEKGTLEGVMQARSAAMSGGQTPAAAAQSEGMLSQALGRLFAVAEAYPNLKANENFLALQNELTSTEDRIASGRRYYNANVRELNTKVETVPSNIVAGLAKIGRAEYFESEGAEREVPSVTFGTAASSAPSPAVSTSPAPEPISPPAPVTPQDTVRRTPELTYLSRLEACGSRSQYWSRGEASAGLLRDVRWSSYRWTSSSTSRLRDAASLSLR
jgi:LemA protein